MARGRERAIEIVVVGLVAAMLYSAWLRDALAAALVALLFWDRVAADDEDSAHDRVADLVVAAFAAVMVATALLSRWPREALLDLRFYPYGILIFFGARRVVAAGRASTIALAVLLLLLVLALDVIAQVGTGASVLTGRGVVWGRYTGSFPFPSDVALLPILFPLASAGLAASPGIRLTIFAFVAAAVAASGTRAALLALVFVAGAESLGRYRRAMAGTIAVLFLGLALAAVVAPGPAERLLGVGGGAQHRFAQWRAALAASTEAPLLGHGPHSFRRLALERHAARDPVFAKVDLAYAPYPHSVYLETLVGSGIVGLAAWLTLLALPYRRRRGGGVALESARIAIAAFAWIALFDLSLKKDWVQLAMWLPLGVAIGAAERRAGTKGASSGAETADR